ncbi:transmembrane amino acid transporter protein [Xylariales sp. PMI_506]|nr:transmembrane amino acid transporter protein [Xylariales sp. PMI_506]
MDLKAGAVPAAVAIRPQQRLLHDPAVTFEEYRYYADKARAEEDASVATAPKTTLLDILFPSRGRARLVEGSGSSLAEEVGAIDRNLNLSNAEKRAGVSDLEWTNANRALRSASAAACFYLITTDILGPFGIGYAIATMGWGQGIGLFTLFGICAGISGYILWKTFMLVDSYEFPAKNYGDLAFRTWGRWLRSIVNFLQAMQLMISVGVIIVSNGQSLSQMAQFKLCYAVCVLLWALVGFGLGQIRTLNKFGWLANFAIVLNLLIMFVSMGVMAHSEPNYTSAAVNSAGSALGGSSVTPDANGNYPPIQTYGGIPPSDNGFIGGINGLMQGVYAYAGAQLFVEFMAEMQRPRDFIKAMWGAQFFIYACYMIYGCYTYYYQGQYANSISYQGLGPYAWQTACNAIAVVSGVIAASLYGNIGIKVVYQNIGMDMFQAPPLHTRAGKTLWMFLVPTYWSIAFIIASGIPYFIGLTGITAAVCFVQFTYTFPAMIGLGLLVKLSAMDGEPGFEPATGQVQRRDAGFARAIRGFMGRYWYINIILVAYALGSLVVSGLGAYSAIKLIIVAFELPQVNAFTCISPLSG